MHIYFYICAWRRFFTCFFRVYKSWCGLLRSNMLKWQSLKFYKCYVCRKFRFLYFPTSHWRLITMLRFPQSTWLEMFIDDVWSIWLNLDLLRFQFVVFQIDCGFLFFLLYDSLSLDTAILSINIVNAFPQLSLDGTCGPSTEISLNVLVSWCFKSLVSQWKWMYAKPHGNLC